MEPKVTLGKNSKLNIGCGMRAEKGYINLDIVKVPGVHIIHDLNVFPYPFPAESFVEIKAEDVLEHVDNIVAVMTELWRIMKTSGTLWIRGPHAAYPLQLWKDPTHKRAFVPESFDNWDPSTYYGKVYGFMFGETKFKVMDRKEVNQGMEFTLMKIRR